MTSLLIPSAVTLLAHKRLSELVEALARKQGAGVYELPAFHGISTVRVNPVDRRVLTLATAARDLLQAGPSAAGPHRLAVGPGIGTYAVLGSGALELPGYADVFAPGGAWVTDALRRGMADENLSRVVAGAAQLAIRAGELGIAATADEGERAKIRAFSMGMLGGVAAWTVLSPVLRGLQAKKSKREWTRDAPAVDIAATEARIVRELLGGPVGAGMWQAWWPASHDVPDALFQGYTQALGEVVGFGAHRPRGFAEFEQHFDAGDALTALRLRNGYSFLRQDAAVSQWGMGTWYAVLLPVLLAPTLTLLVARLLPNAKLFVEGGANERSVFEVLTLGELFGSGGPFVYSTIMWSQIPEHTDAFVNALVLFLARLGLGIGGLAASAGDVDALLRWLLLYAPLAGTDVYAAIRAAISAGGGRPGDAFVFGLQTPALATGLVSLLWTWLTGLAADAAPHDREAVFWIFLALLTAVMLLAVGLPVANALSSTGGWRSFFLRSRAERFPLLDGLAALGRPGDPAALAHLFDDATLWHRPEVAAPTLLDLAYPSGTRTLVRLWWTGGGDLQISHDDHTVTFRKGAGDTIVSIPLASTAADVATALKAALPGLEAEPFDSTDPLYVLPYPHTLADRGDDQATLADHDAHAADFAPVGTSKNGGYLLRHTPRVELTTTYGDLGPSRSPFDAIPLVPSRTLGDLEQTALGLAADLAVMLCMGAAPTLNAGPLAVPPPAIPDPQLAPVYQVFRQWNLDARRVNEWRMLVSGGAVSEKRGHPENRDEGMRPGAAPPVHAADGEPLANAIGWIPLWRAWSRVAADVTADTNADAPAPYTPTVATHDSHRFQPTNRQLSAAVRYLLDLA